MEIEQQAGQLVTIVYWMVGVGALVGAMLIWQTVAAYQLQRRADRLAAGFSALSTDERSRVEAAMIAFDKSRA